MTGFSDRVKRASAKVAAIAAMMAAGAASSTVGDPSPSGPEPELKNETLKAFERYVEITEARNNEELKNGAPEFWVDTLPERERAGAYEALRQGGVQLKKLETRDGGDAIRCPGGMIHHWAGMIFVPRIKLDDALAVLQDYNRHAEYFAPDVQRAKIEEQDGDHFRVFLRFRRKKVITVVLNTVHDVRYYRDSTTRAHSRSSAVRIAEVEKAGKNDEREKTPGDDGGFLWRMETWWRMEERNGGVYVQSEVASLTRNIPTGLGWMIGPFVTSIPKESLTFTLEATRKAAVSRVEKAAGN